MSDARDLLANPDDQALAQALLDAQRDKTGPFAISRDSDRFTEAEADEVLAIAKTLDPGSGYATCGHSSKGTLRHLVDDWRRLRGLIADGIVQRAPGLYEVGTNGIITEARAIQPEAPPEVNG